MDHKPDKRDNLLRKYVPLRVHYIIHSKEGLEEPDIYFLKLHSIKGEKGDRPVWRHSYKD